MSSVETLLRPFRDFVKIIYRQILPTSVEFLRWHKAPGARPTKHISIEFEIR